MSYLSSLTKEYADDNTNNRQHQKQPVKAKGSNPIPQKTKNSPSHDQLQHFIEVFDGAPGYKKHLREFKADAAAGLKAMLGELQPDDFKQVCTILGNPGVGDNVQQATDFITGFILGVQPGAKPSNNGDQNNNSGNNVDNGNQGGNNADTAAAKHHKEKKVVKKTTVTKKETKPAEKKVEKTSNLSNKKVVAPKFGTVISVKDASQLIASKPHWETKVTNEGGKKLLGIFFKGRSVLYWPVKNGQVIWRGHPSKN